MLNNFRVSKIMRDSIIFICILSLIGTGVYGLWPKNVEVTRTIPVFDLQKLDKLFDATLRTFSADKICYDSTTQYYLLHAAPHKKDEIHWDEGWYIMSNYTFLEIENNTYVLGTHDLSNQIYPDITDLKCKEQLTDPKWFKD